MKRIAVGEGSCGIAAGAAKVYSALEECLKGTDIALSITGCIGMCYLEPIVDIYEDDALVRRLVRVTEKDAATIAEAVNGSDWAALDKLSIEDEDKQFLDRQTRIALRNCGIINPADINDYIKHGGYSGLKRVLGSMTPEEQDSPHGSNGTPQGSQRVQAEPSISSATRTRATPARSWTVRSSRAIPTTSSKE